VAHAALSNVDRLHRRAVVVLRIGSHAHRREQGS
jgi:hypothetical protein